MRRPLPTLLLPLLVLAAIAAPAHAQRDVTVPRVEGSVLDVAVRRLEAADLQVAVVWTADRARSRRSSTTRRAVARKPARAIK